MLIAIQARLNVLDTDFRRWVEWGGVRKGPTETEVSWATVYGFFNKGYFKRRGLAWSFHSSPFPSVSETAGLQEVLWRHLSHSPRCTTFCSKHTILHACADLGWSHSLFGRLDPLLPNAYFGTSLSQLFPQMVIPYLYLTLGQRNEHNL